MTQVTINLDTFVEEFVKHLQRESRFLYPNPQHYIYAIDALDSLVAAGVDKPTLGRLVDEVQERRRESLPTQQSDPNRG